MVDRKQLLLQWAERAEGKALRAKDPSVRDTFYTLAILYRDLAKQVAELEELKAKARLLDGPENS
jgi:hypothetical protein